jgi:D-3-phosphoglycerate dehydrogenase
VSTSYPLHKIKVVLLENIHPRAVELFEAAGFSVELHKKAYAGQELIDVAGDAHMVGIRSKTRLTKEFFEQARRLWAVGAFCIGTNQIDLGAAAAHGVPVFNAPFSNTRSVAELTISEIVALHRHLFDRSREVHEGRWLKSATGAHEIRGRTLGIVGYGRIGSQLSVLAEAMGMRVVFYDIVDVLPHGNAARMPSLSALLEVADVVTLHVPGGAGTKHLIGAEQLALMKPGSYLINNARGDVVVIEALAEALKSGRLAGAAIDVFPEEPESNDQPFSSPLQGLPNVILSPHIGGSTAEAQHAIAEFAAGRLTKLMNVGTTTGAVNVPEVELPVLHPDHHRILHFHRNVPGVLGQLHTMIAQAGVNIAAEYLQSDPKHAYCIIDVDSSAGEAIKDGLAQIPETIRVRTLF